MLTARIATMRRRCLSCCRFRLQIAQQPIERRLIGVVILPPAEVRDEVLADLTRGVLAGVRVERLPVADRIEVDEPDREQHLPFLAHFTLACLGDLRRYPLARHARGRQNQQQPVVYADRLVDLLVELAAALHVVRREPAANAFRLADRRAGGRRTADPLSST